MECPVLWRDARLVAVSKPSGLAVHRGWAGEDDAYALQLVRDAVGRRVYPVHRLDRPTSGVLLFALDSATAHVVHEQFEVATVTKRYLALVRGTLDTPWRELDHPVPKKPKGAERVDAVTAIRGLASVLADPETGRAWSLVEARPRTGRVHQIRRHLRHLDHPIVGDVNYGPGDQNRLARVRFGLHRLALHAASLAFDHPETGERVEVRAEIPEDLAGPLAVLGLASVVERFFDGDIEGDSNGHEKENE